MKTPPKRQRVTPKPAIFDTLRQASGALDIPVATLKQAKAAGCPAFVHGRVHREPLLRWMADHRDKVGAEAPADLESAKLARMLEDVRRLRIANDAKQKLLIDRARVTAFLAHFAAGQRAILQQRLENELPTAVAGLQPPEARVVCKRILDEICRDTQEHVRKFAA